MILQFTLNGQISEQMFCDLGGRCYGQLMNVRAGHAAITDMGELPLHIYSSYCS